MISEINLNEHVQTWSINNSKWPFDQAGMTFLETILDFHFHF